MAKVWKVPSKIQSSLPIPKSANEPNKLVSLFEKRDGKWIRISCMQYPASFAGRVFAARLAQAPLSRMLRVVNNRDFDYNEAR
jgi:hypothetical protein